MQDLFIYSIGFLAQILFSSRLIIQWLASEKQRKVITPTLFWSLSIIASILLFIYGFLQNDFAIMFGQLITYFIYVRNLQLQNKWLTIPLAIRWIVIFIPVTTVFYLATHLSYLSQTFLSKTEISSNLLALGIIAQVIFTLRFVYQWLYSEKTNVSTLPKGFWYLSLFGATLILIYGVMRNDIVLIISHLFGIIIYIRNIVLLRNESLPK